MSPASERNTPPRLCRETGSSPQAPSVACTRRDAIKSGWDSAAPRQAVDLRAYLVDGWSDLGTLEALEVVDSEVTNADAPGEDTLSI